MAKLGLCCPSCKNELSALDEEMICMTCNISFFIKDGIVDFIGEENHNGFEVSSERISAVNQQASTEGWFPALYENLSGSPDLLQAELEQVRIGWLFHVFNEERRDACLHLNSKWGTTSFGLSRFYKKVFSLTHSLEHLCFQSIRAEQEDVNNIQLIRSSYQDLPLPADSLDLVVMEDVWNIFGMNGKQAVDDALLKLFIELRRVLKPDGSLYLGVDNVKVDDLRFLLSQARFPDIAAYWAWPSYRYARFSGPMDRYSIQFMINRIKSDIFSVPQRLALEWGARLPSEVVLRLFPFYSSQYFLIAGKKSSSFTLQDKILKNGKNPLSFVSLKTGRSDLLKTTYLLLNDSGVERAVQIKENRSHSGNSSWKITDEAGIQGRVIAPKRRKEVEMVADWLSDFHESSKKDTWSFQHLAEDIFSLQTLIGPQLECKHVRSKLNDFVIKYLAVVKHNPIPVVQEHGDFTRPNILITPGVGLQVIDWEYRRDRGNPMMDVGAFCLSLFRRSTPAGIFPEVMTNMSPEYWFLRAYFARQPIPVTLSPAYYLLRHIARVMADRPQRFVFLELKKWLEMLPPVLDFSLGIDWPVNPPVQRKMKWIRRNLPLNQIANERKKQC